MHVACGPHFLLVYDRPFALIILRLAMATLLSCDNSAVCVNETYESNAIFNVYACMMTVTILTSCTLSFSSCTYVLTHVIN